MDEHILMILVQVFQTQLAIKSLFMFPPLQMSVSALPRENRITK